MLALLVDIIVFFGVWGSLPEKTQVDIEVFIEHYLPVKHDSRGFPVKIKMTKSRDTKGTYVYKNDDDGAAIRSLYITKSAIKDEAPAEITVDIKELK